MLGFFHGNLAYVDIDLSWGTTTLPETFLIDTGFAGDIMISPILAAQLALDIIGTKNIILADGSVVSVYTASAVINIEGDFNLIEVLISDGIPIVGMEFFVTFGYKLHINCNERTVTLEK